MIPGIVAVGPQFLPGYDPGGGVDQGEGPEDTIGPLATAWDPGWTQADITLSDDDRTAIADASGDVHRMTLGNEILTHKQYFEFVVVQAAAGTNHLSIGVGNEESTLNNWLGFDPGEASYSEGDGFISEWDGIVADDGPGSWTAGVTRIMMAVDRRLRLVWFGADGTWLNSGDPEAGTGRSARFGFNYDTLAHRIGCHIGNTTGDGATIADTLVYDVPAGFNGTEPPAGSGSTWHATAKTTGASITDFDRLAYSNAETNPAYFLLLGRGVTALTGLVYWETVVAADQPGSLQSGIISNGHAIVEAMLGELPGAAGLASPGFGGPMAGDAVFYENGNAAVAYDSPDWVDGETVLGHAFDATTRKFWMSVNGSWLNSGDPAAGTGELCTMPAAAEFYAAYAFDVEQGAVRFQAPQYTVPTGFTALA
jgi:hypothetical protein